MNVSSDPAIMRLSIPSELGFEIVARDAVAAFALRVGFSQKQIEDLKTALCEACINAIEHGNSLRPEMHVGVSCLYQSNHLQIEIYDQGLKHHHAAHKPLSIHEKMTGIGSMRGMGLLLIKQLMDEADFVCDTSKGNCFRIGLYRQASTSSHDPSMKQ